jgi:hypothetical protein
MIFENLLPFIFTLADTASCQEGFIYAFKSWLISKSLGHFKIDSSKYNDSAFRTD